MRAHGWERRLGKRFALVIGAAALGAAVIAAGASANFRSVDDPRGDVDCSHRQTCSDRADIVRATAGHGGGRLKHTIRVVGKFQQGYLVINTDSDRACDYVLVARRGRGRSNVRQCDRSDPGPIRTGRARVDFHRHSVEIFFRKRSIGNPQSYGWKAATSVGNDHVSDSDHVPNGHNPAGAGGRYIRHRLGGSGVAAAGVMALGAQTAAAAVIVYDTEVTIHKEAGGNHLRVHGKAKSEVRKCERGRRVVLFKVVPGDYRLNDRKVGTVRTQNSGDWSVLKSSLKLHRGFHRLYAEVKPKQRVLDGFRCLHAHSETIRVFVR